MTGASVGTGAPPSAEGDAQVPVRPRSSDDETAAAPEHAAEFSQVRVGVRGKVRVRVWVTARVRVRHP